jgi:hypothetical protein
MRLLALAVCSVALTGCATKEYQAYADVHKAHAQAQAARYQALADIAKQGDTTAKVAAVMSLQMGGAQGQAHIAAPKSFGEQMLQWTAVLLPSVTQIYSVGKQAQVGITQSNNAREIGISTNAAFVGLAGKIQAPGAVTTTTTNTDSTHAPTVVTQPTPLVVNQPTPVILRPEVVPTRVCTNGPC